MEDTFNGRHSDTTPPNGTGHGPTHDSAADAIDPEALREEAERQLNEAAQQAREKLGDLQSGIENYIREKPVQTLLVAAGVGLLVGTLLKR
ncbi:MAG: hypothetical protein AAGD32_01340 [Planctomycetota bacterium]